MKSSTTTDSSPILTTTTTCSTTSLTPDPSIHMQGIPRQHRQLPRPSLLHSSPTPKPLVRVACVLVGRIYKDAVPISSSPAAHPSNPCAITAPSVSSHPTRDGVIVCDLIHDLARSVYNNIHSLIRHRRLPSHRNNIHSHAIRSKVMSHVDLLIRKFGLP